MILTFDFSLNGVSSVTDLEKSFVGATKAALSQSSFRGLLLWPAASGVNVRLMTEGEDDASALADAIAGQLALLDVDYDLAGFSAEDHGEPPAEIDALPSDERTLAIIRMAFPGPEETCGRCDTILPPHQSWCPWGLGGPENPPGRYERSLGGDDEDLVLEKRSFVTSAATGADKLVEESPEVVGA
jgi:hypothetical protein